MGKPYKLTLEERIAVFTLNDDLLHTKDNAVEYYKIVWREIAREYNSVGLNAYGIVIKTKDSEIAEKFGVARVLFVTDEFAPQMEPQGYMYAFGGLVAGAAVSSSIIVLYHLKMFNEVLCFPPLVGLILGAVLGYKRDKTTTSTHQPLIKAITEAKIQEL